MENPEESIVKANKTNETYTVTWKCMTYVNCEQPCSQVVSTHADQSSIVSQGLSSCGQMINDVNHSDSSGMTDTGADRTMVYNIDKVTPQCMITGVVTPLET